MEDSRAEATQLAFSYGGSDEEEGRYTEGCSLSAELWGGNCKHLLSGRTSFSLSETTNAVGASFMGSPQPLTDPKFLGEAQQAIKQIQGSPLLLQGCWRWL